ncbi:LytR cell envelope-related transcriptional attenuator [Quadrisphaera granulorum]|uniref:LytR cell envelope-related transcriptional attenuator n=1 Tax=Quadrisphaera granulorum TaxID=317664 RepID=A0A315ZU15_9ACTN|nr:LytR C-terminal domain-containing protein [Quadrisphaera granulorum]PWJ49035.1 LytR cell envelope-related transcriptional attenuator [Quadrisphaera granulorum]SZE98245.1 LytR cell envelope-related transcriptional attenuator [Quadrisphaera granulorum]
MSSPYPRDDFDAVTPPRDGRRGAHRAAPRRSGGALAPVVIVLVVAAALGAGWMAWTTTSNPASAGPKVEASAAPAAGADQPADDASAPSTASSPSDPSAPSDAATPDRSTPVVVLNGTGTQGLAAKRAEALKADGWTVASTGNATAAQRSAHQGITVLHPTEELQGAAEALAAEIGGTAVLDPKAEARSLTVVLR